MNDPHVVALMYRIRHDGTIDYSRAERLERDEPKFRLTVEKKEVRFEFKEHFSTEQQARETIGDYIRIWEFDATLKYGNPDSFRLEFVTAKIIDRNPSPDCAGVVEIFEKIHVSDSLKLTLSVSKYPSPPSDIALNPEAETMYQRYMGYLQQREPLPGMAYFCLPILEDPPTADSKKRCSSGKRKDAAERFGIDENVLDRIGELSSTKGGTDARKWKGTNQSLSSKEHKFLDCAVKAIIRRVAEREHAGIGNLPKLSLSDLLDDEVSAGV
ncbi:MAG: hypothetical protein F4Z15_10045 [Gammaproteobacteria bacterium]|nr:hypothetical protein [Gammaproteobacteria bacterium]MYD75379.1 hypothetical protein [Gammaproteobacteria bacterium]MYJ53023.1 hypothetical protein [Gammaproteobacteria bacterium]